MARTSREGQYRLRSASAVIPFWIGVALAVVVVGTALVRADWRLLGFALAPALLLVWVLWMVLYRPSVSWDSTSATIVNIGRRHVVPWGRVRDVRQSVSLVFELESGKRIEAWGAPTPRRRGNIQNLLDRRTRPPEENFHANSELLNGARLQAPPQPGEVVSSWDRVPLLIGLVLALAVVVQSILGV